MSASSLVHIQPIGSNRPFFCVHGAQTHESALFGSGALFAKLARRLGPEQPFYSFCLDHATQGRAEPLTIEGIAAGFLRDVRSRQPSGPYFLGGWSFGGLVAYEMAQQLRAQGETVALLALIDTHGPGYPRKRPWLEQLRLHCTNLGSLSMHRRPGYFLRALGALAHAKWIPFRRAMGKLLGKVDPWARVMQIERSYLAGIAVYPGPIVLFVATETLAETADQVSVCCDPHLGWESLVKGEIASHHIHGTHHTMFEEPGLTELADQLAAHLDKPPMGSPNFAGRARG